MALCLKTSGSTKSHIIGGKHGGGAGHGCGFGGGNGGGIGGGIEGHGFGGGTGGGSGGNGVGGSGPGGIGGGNGPGGIGGFGGHGLGPGGENGKGRVHEPIHWTIAKVQVSTHRRGSAFPCEIQFTKQIAEDSVMHLTAHSISFTSQPTRHPAKESPPPFTLRTQQEDKSRSHNARIRTVVASLLLEYIFKHTLVWCYANPTWG